jgi:hypothetical protein
LWGHTPEGNTTTTTTKETTMDLTNTIRNAQGGTPVETLAQRQKRDNAFQMSGSFCPLKGKRSWNSLDALLKSGIGFAWRQLKEAQGFNFGVSMTLGQAKVMQDYLRQISWCCAPGYGSDRAKAKRFLPRFEEAIEDAVVEIAQQRRALR